VEPGVVGSSPTGGTILSPAENSDHTSLKSAHARYAAYTAARLGYDFQSLDGADGYLFEVGDGVRVATFAAGAGSPYALNDVRAASIARDKAFCADVLRRAHVPALAGEKFFVTPRWRAMRNPGREAEDAVAYVRAAPLPVFCKPLAASNGLYAEVIESAQAFEDYVRRVSREHFAILVQPYVRAPEYRVFVLNGRPLFSYRKVPPSVVGDGVQALAALIDALPRDDAAPAPSRKARGADGRRFANDAVLAVGERAWLEGPANRSAGGGAEDLRDGAPEDLARVALAAADALALRLAGVDVFDEGGCISVIEVNSNPMIATLEDHGRWDLIQTIWSANIDAALR
jgi:glutathione synthase/RimK-type ligase-like ATP-grasp enzyme